MSRHIRLLAEAGLVERHQEGSWVFVRAAPDPAIRLFVDTALSMIATDDAQIALDAGRAAQIRANRAAMAQAYFDQNASEWDRIRSLHVAEQDVERAILDALGPGPYDLILDLGTGTGRILELAHDRARQLVGIDTNREMLKCARVRLDLRVLPIAPSDLPTSIICRFPKTAPDAVLIHQVLHFLDDPRAALAEAVRVLKPEGHLAVIDFAPHSLEFLREDHAHVRLGFAANEIAAWLKSVASELPRTASFPRGMSKRMR